MLTCSPIDDIFFEETLKVIYETYGTESSFFFEFGGEGEESGLFLKEQGMRGTVLVLLIFFHSQGVRFSIQPPWQGVVIKWTQFQDIFCTSET